MVVVGDVEIEAEIGGEAAQQEEECHGVGAAGDRDDERSGREEVVLTHEREDRCADRSRRLQRWLEGDSDPRQTAYESAALPLSYPASTRFYDASWH